VLTPHTPLGWFAFFGVGGAVARDAADRRHHCCSSRVSGIWAITQPVAWGYRDHQLRLVDRYWPRGTLISAILLLLQQGWRNSTTALPKPYDFRRGLRGHVPADPRGPSLAWVLAVSAALHHDSVAAVPVSAALDVFAVSTYAPSSWSSGTWA